MGLFGGKTNYKETMRSCLKNIMLDLVKSDPEFGNAVVPIISDAELMIRQQSENELAKGIRENHVNVECAALNILQNCAMYSIKPKSTYDYLSSAIHGEEDYANRLFDYVNKLKFEKGYISKEQYDENALLATKLSISSPLGDWF